METTTFITIHDLSPEAHILYSSDSIVDILGHTPDEVINKPCWEFFHRDIINVAKIFHDRTVKFDKAAVLAYCNLRHRNGYFVNCECCFTCVYNVMVVCTSLYRPTASSQKRANEAPIVRRLFSSSPQDPRYHMLSHLSAKFQKGLEAGEPHEPRAALFLNRFTRTATIMYATSGIEQIIGISGEEMKGRSFYFCIAANCLEDAVNCIENAKANDSIAYLRFWYRDPRQDDEPRHQSDSSVAGTDEADMTDVTDNEGGEDGDGGFETSAEISRATTTASASSSNPGQSRPAMRDSRSSSMRNEDSHRTSRSTQSTGTSTNSPTSAHYDPIELEAVVSCTSDGLVVIIRRARPLIPGSIPAQMQSGLNNLAQPQQYPPYGQPQAIFAAPWAQQPFFAPQQIHPAPAGWWHGMHPQYVQPAPRYPLGPSPHDFMNSIREVAAFAWGVVGINGTLSDYGRGKSLGDSQPYTGLPVWDPQARNHLQHWPSTDSGNATQSDTTSPVPFAGGHGGTAKG